MHGKDFVLVLAWFVRPYVGVSQLAHPEVVARMLACCIDRDEAASLGLFEGLSQLTATDSAA